MLSGASDQGRGRWDRNDGDNNRILFDLEQGADPSYDAYKGCIGNLPPLAALVVFQVRISCLRTPALCYTYVGNPEDTEEMVEFELYE